MDRRVSDMRILRRRVVSRPEVIVIAALLVAPVLWGTESGDRGDRWDAGACAPDGCWYIEGGCAAGTGVTDTAPLRGPLHVEWTVTPDGEIEGEPLVWEDYVVLAVRKSGKCRYLQVLDLLTGREIGCKRFSTVLPLAPSLWGGMIVVRSGPHELRAYTIGYTRLNEVWRSPPTRELLSAPLFFEQEIYVGAGQKLLRLSLFDRKNPVWAVPAGSGCAGRPALRGDHVFVTSMEPRNWPTLRQIDRKTGMVFNSYRLQHVTLADSHHSVSNVNVAVYHKLIVLRFPHPLICPAAKLEGFTRFGVNRYSYRTTQTPDYVLSLVVNNQIDAAEWKRGWLSLSSSPEKGNWWYLVSEQNILDVISKPEEGTRLHVLASESIHSDFLDPVVQPSIARNVAFIGSRAFDLETLKILWNLHCPTTRRAVPCRETLLITGVDGTLRALRNDVERADSAIKSPCLQSDGGTAVLRDGSVLDGDFLAHKGSGKLIGILNGRSRKQWDLGELFLLFDGNREILYSPGPDDSVRGIEQIVRHRLAREYNELVRLVRRSASIELMQRVCREAKQANAELKEVHKLEKELAKQKQHPHTPNQRIAAQVEARLAKLEQLRSDTFWDFARATLNNQDLTAGERIVYGYSYLRKALEADPRHVEACREVRERLPAGIDIPASFDSLDWLDFLEAIHQSPVELIDPPHGTGDQLNESQRRLRVAMYTWRRDLVALRSENLLIVTPLERPGAIARCLSMGELVCTMLNDVFPERAGEIQSRQHLLLYLYPTKEEYLSESQPSARGDRSSALEFSAGHYHRKKHLSRIYLPEDERQFESVMRTYAHELTHHWLAARFQPRSEDWMRSYAQRGFWLVEGFATFVEESRFDLHARTYELSGRQVNYLDEVANVKRSPEGIKLLAWHRLFAMSDVDFQSLSRSSIGAIPLTWTLGIQRDINAISLFYSQSAAACSYLFNSEQGRYRESLLRLVERYYRGQTERYTIDEALGLDATALCVQIESYAEEAQTSGESLWR